MVFGIGDIIELDKDILFYYKGLIAKVVELEEGNCGWVKIIKSSKSDIIGQEKYTNLTLFKLVRRKGLHV